jgi:hypothetical protein
MKAMKTMILILMVCLLPFAGAGQSGLFEELTRKYSDRDGFSASRITSDMFDLYVKKRNIDEKSPVFDALKSLDNILVVTQSNWKSPVAAGDANKSTDDEMHQLFLQHYSKNNFTLLKTEKQMGEDVKVYLKKNQDKIESVALVTKSPVMTQLIELQGNIDLKNVSQLSQALNLRGLENLYKISGSGPRAVFVAPPDPHFSEERIQEMSRQMREMAEKQHFMTDEQRRQLEEQTKHMVEKQRIMGERYREMAEKYQRNPIFLSEPGDTSTVYYINGKKVKSDEIRKISQDNIQSIEITKKNDKTDKTTIRIKTKE